MIKKITNFFENFHNNNKNNYSFYITLGIIVFIIFTLYFFYVSDALLKNDFLSVKVDVSDDTLKKYFLEKSLDFIFILFQYYPDFLFLIYLWIILLMKLIDYLESILEVSKIACEFYYIESTLLTLYHNFFLINIF